MATSKDNVQLMIEAFTDYREGDDHSRGATDVLIRTLLDHSKVPTYQQFLVEDNNDVSKDVWRDFDVNPKTDAEKAEIFAMGELMNGGNIRTQAGEIQLWESHDDLMALLITYPPVILEQLLITGFVIYLLRADNVDIDADTDTFNEFYKGWGSVVRGTC